MTQLHHGDNLAIMRDMETGSVDLIYADPPFNSGKDWGEYDDRWASDNAYIAFMRERLLEMKRLLKPTGSLYLHCDPTMSHYLKVLMDAVFGRAQFPQRDCLGVPAVDRSASISTADARQADVRTIRKSAIRTNCFEPHQ